MREKIVFVSLGIANLNYVLYNSIGLSNVEKIYFRIIVIALIVLSFLIQKNSFEFKRIDLYWLFLSMIPILGFSLNEKMLNFIYLLLVLISSRNIHIDKYYRKLNFYNLMIVILVVVLLKLGIIQNTEQIIGDRVRNTFGFNNINAFATLMYSVTMVFLLSRDTIRIRNIIFIIGFLIAIYRYTDTRNVLYSVLIFILTHIFLKKLVGHNINKNIVFKILITISCLMPVILSLVSPLLLNKFPGLDKIVSARLTLNSYFISTNTIKNILLGGTNARDIDNGYLLLLYSLGILFFIFSITLIVKSLFILVNRGDTKSVSFIISFMFFSAFESLLIRPELSVCVLFWIMIYKTNVEDSKMPKNLRKGIII